VTKSTVVHVSSGDAGFFTVAIELRETAAGSRRYRLLRKPWEHYYAMPAGVTVEEVFHAMTAAMSALAGSPRIAPRSGPAPLEGPQGERLDHLDSDE